MKMYFDINEVKKLYNIAQDSPLLPKENEPTFYLMIHRFTGLFTGERKRDYIIGSNDDFTVYPSGEYNKGWSKFIDNLDKESEYCDGKLFHFIFPIASSWLDMTLEHNINAKFATLDITTSEISISLE